MVHQVRLVTLDQRYFDLEIADKRAIPTAVPPPKIGNSPFAPGESCMRKTMAMIAIAQIPRFTIDSVYINRLISVDMTAALVARVR